MILLFFIPTVFGMSGSWEAKTNVHLRHHFILLCFEPGIVLYTFQTQISAAVKRKKTGHQVCR